VEGAPSTRSGGGGTATVEGHHWRKQRGWGRGGEACSRQGLNSGAVWRLGADAWEEEGADGVEWGRG